MSGRASLRHRARAVLRDESGATLVEFAVAIVAVLLIFLGTVDFGRMLFHRVAAEKALHRAVRIAAVRPPACANVPEVHERPDAPGTGTLPSYGTSCSAGSGVCKNAGTQICTAATGNATAEEVWALVRPTLPNTATISNLRFRYAFDPDLGFLGGPYVPNVTVELQDLNFTFVALLPQLTTLAVGADDAFAAGTVAFPALGASVPGEDLALGTDG